MHAALESLVTMLDATAVTLMASLRPHAWGPDGQDRLHACGVRVAAGKNALLVRSTLQDCAAGARVACAAPLRWQGR